MHIPRISFLALGVVAAALAPAQFDILNEATANAYNPTTDYQSQHFAGSAVWDSVGRKTDVSATSESHPWDPPINVATAMSDFTQPTYGNATFRAMSFAISDYSGTGSSLTYSANSSFQMKQRLNIEVGSGTEPFVHVQILAPMHGLLAARGSFGTNAYARANMDVKALNAAGSLISQTSGGLELVSTDYNVFTYTATGDWAGNVGQTTVNLPTGGEPRDSQGLELATFGIIDLGLMPTMSTQTITLSYAMNTSVTLNSPSSQFGLSDFSGTGSLTFKAFDSQEHEFTNFTVYPEAVPEPATLAFLGMGLVGLMRRRRAA